MKGNNVELVTVNIGKDMKARIQREAFDRSSKEDRYVSYKEVVEKALCNYYGWKVEDQNA